MNDPNPSDLPPPFHNIPGLSNFRDIGGWPIATPPSSNTNPDALTPAPPPQYRVRHHILHRSADPTLLPLSSQKTLSSAPYNISTIFDIRSIPQLKRAGGAYDFSSHGIERVWLPVFGEEEYTPEKAGLRYVQYSADGTEGIVGAFEEILRAGGATFAHILLDANAVEVVDGEGKDRACLLQCTTGNNRSGAFIAVLLSLLGVSPSHIAHEYSLSAVGLAATRAQSVERLLKNAAFVAAVGDQAPYRAERMLGARPESVIAMLEMVERRWGGAEGYVRGVCGLEVWEVERVRRVMVEKVEGDG
ncbi:putative tyrosine-protein phosphatase [Patellaria atrata CBS 101060]|uniref:Tyrosine-protein phosphatase n=1 Tax=Patellaria atrata CBS 101060 TaxID=1346257 RepID=A0A9P4VUM7_9PEZI|nr:putative tyrosine-protein phosphatase [Patellaria atrata CBS 101060]